MADPIQSTNIPASKFVAFTSRYASSNVIYYTKNKVQFITFNTYVTQPIPPSPQDTFLVLPVGYEYRPDKLSQKAYGVPDYWWKIMEANNISDIFDFKAGINIRIPNSSNII